MAKGGKVQLKEYIIKASILRRIIAFIIDMFILDFVVFSPFSGLVEKSMTIGSFSETVNSLVNNPTSMGMIMKLMAVITILSIAYFTLMQWKLGQTIGMMVLGIFVTQVRVIEIKKIEFIKPTFIKCLLRNLFIIPVFPFVLLWLMEPFFIIARSDNRRLLELLSATMVVEKYSNINID